MIKPKVTFNIKDQVVVRRPLLYRGPQTNEILVGDILAFSSNGRNAEVSLPDSRGGFKRMVVPISSLEKVSERFKRSRVQVNPAFRQIQ